MSHHTLLWLQSWQLISQSSTDDTCVGSCRPLKGKGCGVLQGTAATMVQGTQAPVARPAQQESGDFELHHTGWKHSKLKQDKISNHVPWQQLHNTAFSNPKWVDVSPNHKAFIYPSPAAQSTFWKDANHSAKLTRLLVPNSWITIYIHLQGLFVKTNRGRCLGLLPTEGQQKGKVLWTSRETTHLKSAFQQCPANTAVSWGVHLTQAVSERRKIHLHLDLNFVASIFWKLISEKK